MLLIKNGGLEIQLVFVSFFVLSDCQQENNIVVIEKHKSILNPNGKIFVKKLEFVF